MTTPREDAIAEVRSNWPDDYTPAEAKAWIAACDRIEFALDAAAETPDLRAAVDAGYREGYRAAEADIAAHISPETVERLARALHRQSVGCIAAGTDLRRDHASHVGDAAAILAAMRETGR